MVRPFVFGRWFVTLVMLLFMGQAAWAGLYGDTEKVAELPADWRGLLADLRLLRQTANATAPVAVGSLRDRYRQALNKLTAISRERALTAAEEADRGLLLIRIGKPTEAVGVLRAAQTRFPSDFAIAANLGTAWHHLGDLDRAADQLRTSVALAPTDRRRAEQLHLQLVQLRRQEARRGTGIVGDLDPLFGGRYELASGDYPAGKLDEDTRHRLPTNAVALVQHLALCLPDDGRLIWQLGELAAAYGDIRNAEALLDLAQGEYGLSHPRLLRHRAALRTASAERAVPTPAGVTDLKAAHAAHGGTGIAFKSQRALILERLDPRSLPAIRRDAANNLPWALLAETALDRRFRPTFPTYLKDLDGLEVTFLGYMHPLGDDLEVSAFLAVEAPVGCWYCELPSTTGIVLVELAEGTTTPLTRGMIKVTGKLRLNAEDPEDFLFTLRDARVSVPD